MFGFSKRRKFNTAVDGRLRELYKIDTDHQSNPAFPGQLAYLTHLDDGWNAKVGADHGALRIALLYFMGQAKNGGPSARAEAVELARRLPVMIAMLRAVGELTAEQAAHYNSTWTKYAAQYLYGPRET